jgi:hypothetical protein
VNQAKSAVDRPWKRKFLGFSFSVNKQPKVRIAKQSIQKAKDRIREITSRKKPMKMEERINELNQYLIGWCGYFSLTDTPSICIDMDKWIRRRLRMCLWKQWKLPKTKVKRLVSLGIPKDKAFEWGNARKGYWRVAGSPILSRVGQLLLEIQWSKELDGQIQQLTEYFMNRRIPNGTYGGVRGRGLITPSYSIICSAISSALCIGPLPCHNWSHAKKSSVNSVKSYLL